MVNLLNTRPSPIAGQWYPSDGEVLAERVDNYMDAARLPNIDGDIIAVMAPHAGHEFSGPVAGYAFAALRGKTPDLVIVVSPMHYPYFEPLLTTAHSEYATPLGTLTVDHDALNTLDTFLLAKLGFGLTRVGHDSEHSLEIELPFLQRVLGNPFQLVPIMVRDQSVRVARSLGEAIASLMTCDEKRDCQSALLVASTDLSHFYPQEVARKLDAEVLRQVEEFNPAGVIQVEEEGKGYACGRGALAAVLFAAQGLGADHAQILHYATSGEITGDYSRVVGYAAAVITQ